MWAPGEGVKEMSVLFEDIEEVLSPGKGAEEMSVFFEGIEELPPKEGVKHVSPP